MYNDHGSLVRDAEECNLNSINFAESSSFASYGGGEEVVIEEKGAKAAELVVEEEEEERKLKPSSSSSSAKSELLWIAEYERRGLDAAKSLLASELGGAQSHLMRAFRMFVDVTDLYGQLYVLMDVGARTQRVFRCQMGGWEGNSFIDFPSL
ncbi:hypothetical protein PG989_002286 [Apiospora arundinis]